MRKNQMAIKLHYIIRHNRFISPSRQVLLIKLAVIFLILITIGTATAQIATPEYISPVTIKKVDVTYEVNSNGTYTKDGILQIQINIDQAVQSAGHAYLAYSELLQSLEVLEAYTETATGERIDVPADKIFTQQSPISTGAPAFDDIKVKAVVFPQISVGASENYHIMILTCT
jgi:hypothetical protein